MFSLLCIPFAISFVYRGFVFLVWEERIRNFAKLNVNHILFPRNDSPREEVMSKMRTEVLQKNAFTPYPEYVAVAYCKGIADVLCILPRFDVGWRDSEPEKLLFWGDARPEEMPFPIRTSGWSSFISHHRQESS